MATTVHFTESKTKWRSEGRKKKKKCSKISYWKIKQQTKEKERKKETETTD